jgi:hypothetical protein
MAQRTISDSDVRQLLHQRWDSILGYEKTVELLQPKV